MGDRSNVFIQTHKDPEFDSWSGIGVYSHCGGRDLHEAALAALATDEVQSRKGDPSYFAARLIRPLMGTGDMASGLWLNDRPDDNEYPVLVINAETGEAWYCPEGHHQRPLLNLEGWEVVR